MFTVTNSFLFSIKKIFQRCYDFLFASFSLFQLCSIRQRLIDFEKNNWDPAPEPMKDHGFEDPSSWTDEYKRIYEQLEGC